ncbi:MULTISPECIES: LysR family transcriptional regulator [unclassified Mameliella]|uniref:LysR family transcriptional regulator n=1 Tax=unclassified Mameliella TaxID=2630630 RepID=UPI00273ECB49|nr:MULTISPECIES: LysR family transcriptional regulator [unclassified Mameliella]
MRPRRFLPSIRQLLALDAVVRHRSVTAAACELDLTQSTVSRLILSLEEQLGTELFTRQRKRLVPKSAALAYQKDIGAALDLIQSASTRVVANPDGGTLSLAVLPTFATRWLGPRLGHFLQQHPGVSVNLSTRIKRFDFSAEVFDAAIYYGEADWPAVRHLRLFEERATACAAPEYIAAAQLSGPADLTEHSLLYLESRPDAWGDWFHAHDVAASIGGGMMVDQFSMMIQAAISGIGIALLPDYIAQAEIAEGRLQPLYKQAVPMRGAYWMAWPEENSDVPPLRALRHWLEAEVSTTGS